jgi:hypothetical protein
MKKIVTTLLFATVLVIASSAQTKLIALRSHSGCDEEFNISGDGNFGFVGSQLPGTEMKKRDSLLRAQRDSLLKKQKQDSAKKQGQNKSTKPKDTTGTHKSKTQKPVGQQ